MPKEFIRVFKEYIRMPWKEYKLYSDEKSGFDVWNIEVFTVLNSKMDNLEPLQCTDKLVIIGKIACLGSFLAPRYINHCL